MKIQLSRERRAALIAAVRAHFLERHEEEIGELKAGFLVDLFVEQLGPVVYNQGVRDAQRFVQERLLDLDAEVYAPEPRGSGESK